MKRDPRWLRIVDAAYGVALRLYPREFRMRWGAPMRQAFRDRCRECAGNGRSRAGLLLEMLPDLAIGAGRERIGAMEGTPMSRRNWMFVLLFTFAAMLAMHDRIGTASLAAVDWWKQHQADLDAAAVAKFYRDAGTTLERTAAVPRDHTLAALFLARAGDPGASREWREALAARDPLALWISAVDCPVATCDARAAVAALVRIEPDNAAIGQLELNLAAKANDATAMRIALRRMAEAQRYDSRWLEMVKGLLRAVDQVPVPRRLFDYGHDAQGRAAARTVLAAGVWMPIAQPAFAPFLEACRAGAAADIARDCVAAARVVAQGDTLIARSFGVRAWYRSAASDAERAEAVSWFRDQRWLTSNAVGVFETDTAAGVVRLRDAWLRNASEVEVFRSLERERGIAAAPPASFQPDLEALAGH
jgi:hypothetical protein